jgi:hypothetical protein
LEDEMTVQELILAIEGDLIARTHYSKVIGHELRQHVTKEHLERWQQSLVAAAYEEAATLIEKDTHANEGDCSLEDDCGIECVCLIRREAAAEIRALAVVAAEAQAGEE